MLSTDLRIRPETSDDQRELFWEREALLTVLREMQPDERLDILNAIDRLDAANGSPQAFAAALESAGEYVRSIAYTLAWCQPEYEWAAKLQHWLMYEWERARKQITDGVAVEDIY